MINSDAEQVVLVVLALNECQSVKHSNILENTSFFSHSWGNDFLFACFSGLRKLSQVSSESDLCVPLLSTGAFW